jgi:hypothetical protein
MVCMNMEMITLLIEGDVECLFFCADGCSSEVLGTCKNKILVQFYFIFYFIFISVFFFFSQGRSAINGFH